MKIKQKDLDILNSFLNEWKGANAYWNNYVDTDDRMIVALEKADNVRDAVGICFTQCRYISGSTRWSGADLKAQIFHFDDEEIGFEIIDLGSGFVLRCEGAIVVGGDNDFIVPRS
mgnify:FL=1